MVVGVPFMVCRRRRTMQACDLLVEGGEEVVGKLACRRVDEPRADLRELAAYAGLDLVGKARCIAFGSELHLRAALAEAGNAALSLERDRVGLRRLQIGKRELALELGCDR